MYDVLALIVCRYGVFWQAGFENVLTRVRKVELELTHSRLSRWNDLQRFDGEQFRDRLHAGWIGGLFFFWIKKLGLDLQRYVEDIALRMVGHP